MITSSILPYKCLVWGKRVTRRAALITLVFLFPLFNDLRPAGAGEMLAEILEGIKNNYAYLEGLTVSYERDVVTQSMAMLDEGIKSDLAEGLIHFKPPQFLRIEQQKPRAERVVSDGETLWWYIPENKEVYRYPAGKLGQELKLLSDIFKGLKDVVDGFVVEITASKTEGRRDLKLTPNPAWPEIDFIHLSVSERDHTIRVVKLHNYLGGFTRFVLGDIRAEDGFQEDFFTFKVPEGVRVIQE